MERIEIISAALSRTDPEGLIKMGAPPQDEYNHEAKLIDQMLKKGDELTEELVIEVFEYSFSQDIIKKEPYNRAYLEIKKAIEA